MNKAINLIIILFLLFLLPQQNLWCEGLERASVANTKTPFTKGYPLELKSYSIQSIPFETYEIPQNKDSLIIVFSQYASQTKVVYPTPKDRIPANATDIVKRCQKALKDNIDKIINTQQENEAVKRYLSLNNKVMLFKKEDYLSFINNPQEQTVQIEPKTRNIIAEFRSQEITLDENNYFCQYLTFIYNTDKNRLNKIIISAVKLIKQI